MINEDNLEIREYTSEEIRHLFLLNVWQKIDFFDSSNQSNREKLEGLAHSILSMLDGNNPSLPAFIVAPLGTKEDQEYCQSRGEKWFPINDGSQIKGDIGGELHTEFYPSNPYSDMDKMQ